MKQLVLVGLIMCLLSQMGLGLLTISLNKLLVLQANEFSALNISTKALSSQLNRISVTKYLRMTQVRRLPVYFDIIQLQQGSYSKQFNCYSNAVMQINNLYEKKQPCSDNCKPSNHMKVTPNLASVNIDLASPPLKPFLGLLIDNSLYPCRNGSFEPELELMQSIEVVVDFDSESLFLLKIILFALIQLFFLLLAAIYVLANELNTIENRQRSIEKNEEVNKMLQRQIVHCIGE